MTIKQNESGKWCVYGEDGSAISEHETEDEAKAAMKDGGSKLASMTSRVKASGDKGESDVLVLFDTGATLSFVTRSVAEKLATITKMPKPYNIIIGDGSSLSVKDMAVLVIKAAGQTMMDTFLVLEKGVEDVILGEATMRKFGLKIDLERSVIFSEMRTEEERENQETKIKKEKKRMNEFLKKLFAALAIDAGNEEITEEKAIGMIVAAKQQSGNIPTTALILKELDLAEGANESQIYGAIVALKNPGNVVATAKFNEIKTELLLRDIDLAIDRALADGKLSPAEKPWALDFAKGNLAAFEAFIEKRPKVVPVYTKLPPGSADKGVEIDEVQASINEQLKVSPEMFRKYHSRAN